MLIHIEVIIPRSCWQQRIFFSVLVHGVLYFQLMCVFLHSCQHSGKIIGVVDNNPEKCSNMNISTNSKPYANLLGLHLGAQADVFYEESWDERFCGTFPLINLFYFTFLRIILLQRHVHCTVRKSLQTSRFFIFPL